MLAGVTHLDAYSSLGTDALKRHMLFVDHFLLLGTHWVMRKCHVKKRENPLYEDNEREIEFLMSRELASEYGHHVAEHLVSPATDFGIPHELIWAFMCRLDGPEIEAHLASKTTKTLPPGGMRHIVDCMAARLHAEVLSKTDIPAVSLHYLDSYEFNKGHQQTNALRITVDRVCISSSETPWQDIIDLKADKCTGVS